MDTSLRDWAVLHQNTPISLNSFDRIAFLDLLWILGFE
jgi:hypothetical protein